VEVVGAEGVRLRQGRLEALTVAGLQGARVASAVLRPQRRPRRGAGPRGAARHTLWRHVSESRQPGATSRAARRAPGGWRLRQGLLRARCLGQSDFSAAAYRGF